ncbi:MAG: redox-regulated ATPase YchF [Candidatus Omnitrophica bacterium]|nr:redox-regulated ATPase YchF [Candidatus Omnitrophota bacterium]
MEIGVLGLPQTGKKTLFNLLTEGSLKAESHQKASKDPGVGISKVHDERLHALSAMYKPKKTVPATIKYILLPSMTKNSEENRAAFTSISTVDALCHVVRAFEDDTVFHIEGSVDPVRDINYVESELLLNDLLFVEGRIEKLEHDIKRKNDPKAKKEKEIMEQIMACLNEDRPLRLVEFSEEEKKIINAYPLLTRKNMLIVLNVGEEDITNTALVKKIQSEFAGRGIHCVDVSCKIEMELSEITDPQEKKMFLEDLGIASSALERITKMSYDVLGYLTFFTVGEDECRAWTVRQHTLAPQAGGTVHSDIERGFIRAEHMRVDELLKFGSEQALKDAGKFSLKGKDYVVRDGDILHFRFNV